MSGDIHALSGAYAVDALDEFERARVDRHLAECADCRAEVDSLREAAAVMAETTALAPPASLRDRVLTGIDAVRPLPPLVSAVPDRARSGRRRFPALVAAAAVLVALGGGIAWHPWTDDGTTQVELSATQRVLKAPDAETFTGTLHGGATATVTRSRSADGAVWSASGLNTLPSGQVYALWLQGSNGMVFAGTLDNPDDEVLLHGVDPTSAAGAGITIEDESGDPGPTLDPEHFLGSVPFKKA